MNSSMRNQQSLVARLVRISVYWALPILILAAMALTWVYQSSTYRIFDDPIESAVTSLIAAAEIPEMAKDIEQTILVREPTDPRYQQALSGRYWLIGRLSEDGSITPIKASRSLLDETLLLSERDAQHIISMPGVDIKARATGPDNEPLRVNAQNIILSNLDSQPLLVLAAVDSRPATQAVRNFGGIAIFLMAILTLGLVSAVFIQVRLGLKPLFNLRDDVTDVREGRSDRVGQHYPKEIQPLATELNFLIDHNKDVVERARTHVSNLAHALKTPIAVLMNESAAQKGSKAPFAEIVSRQTQSMHSQVEHHLRRARAAARGQTIGVSSDVSETVESLARTMPRIYRAKDFDLSVIVEEGLAFRGEKRDLEDMVGNLMDNACKWSVSRVKLTAHTMGPDVSQFVLSVEDDGPGIADEDYKNALKRGIRLDEATPGTGFGLSIVDDLAQAYKGSLALARSDMGGLKATLTLPKRIG